MPKRKLGAEQKVTLAIDLMELLAASGDGSLALDDLERELKVGTSELEELVDLVSTLADRETGTRAVCYIEDGRARLVGEAGRILPLRLTAAEGAVLDHELDMLDIEPAARERIRSSLLSGTIGYEGRVGGSAAVGAFWQPLHEAIEDGARIRILYRSLDDERSRWRIVDPLSIDTRGDRTYLHAWDIEEDHPKRYRLDKIENVEVTDESVEHHNVPMRSLGDSLADAGRTARLGMPANVAEHLSWAGVTGVERHGDTAIATVAYTSEHWLLSQVLSFGGKIRIVDDPELVQKLREFAQALRTEC